MSAQVHPIEGRVAESAPRGQHDLVSFLARATGTARGVPWGWAALRSPSVLVAVDLAAIYGGITLAGRVDGLALVWVLVLPLWLAALGRYHSRISPTLQRELVPLLGALCVPVLVLALLRTPSATSLWHAMPAVVALVVCGRVVGYGTLRVARARTTQLEPTVIVGAGVLGCAVAQALLEHPEYGLAPVGFLDGYPDEGGLPVPILGDLDDLYAVVARHGVQRVVVAFGANREVEVAEVLRASAAANLEVHLIPRLFELGVTPGGTEVDFVWGFPLQHARRAALRTPAWRTKRVLDVAVSGAALVALSPLMAAAALAVRLSSRGPVLFRQRRIGQRGQVVEIYKFRSMRVNDESDRRWGTLGDDRITGVGRLLRATSIDELPQLFNVVRGDMSLVGPRPERPVFSERFSQQVYRYKDRLRVPVGLTGWAQVHGLRGDTSIEERARFDNYYIEHWSLWLDILILARTAGQVLREVAANLRRRDRSGDRR